MDTHEDLAEISLSFTQAAVFAAQGVHQYYLRYFGLQGGQSSTGAGDADETVLYSAGNRPDDTKTHVTSYSKLEDALFRFLASRRPSFRFFALYGTEDCVMSERCIKALSAQLQLEYLVVNCYSGTYLKDLLQCAAALPNLRLLALQTCRGLDAQDWDLQQMLKAASSSFRHKCETMSEYIVRLNKNAEQISFSQQMYCETVAYGLEYIDLSGNKLSYRFLTNIFQALVALRSLHCLDVGDATLLPLKRKLPNECSFERFQSLLHTAPVDFNASQPFAAVNYDGINSHFALTTAYRKALRHLNQNQSLQTISAQLASEYQKQVLTLDCFFAIHENPVAYLAVQARHLTILRVESRDEQFKSWVQRYVLRNAEFYAAKMSADSKFGASTKKYTGIVDMLTAGKAFDQIFRFPRSSHFPHIDPAGYTAQRACANDCVVDPNFRVTYMLRAHSQKTANYARSADALHARHRPKKRNKNAKRRAGHRRSKSAPSQAQASETQSMQNRVRDCIEGHEKAPWHSQEIMLSMDSDSARETDFTIDAELELVEAVRMACSNDAKCASFASEEARVDASMGAELDVLAWKPKSYEPAEPHLLEEMSALAFEAMQTLPTANKRLWYRYHRDEVLRLCYDVGCQLERRILRRSDAQAYLAMQFGEL